MKAAASAAVFLNQHAASAPNAAMGLVLAIVFFGTSNALQLFPKLVVRRNLHSMVRFRDTMDTYASRVGSTSPDDETGGACDEYETVRVQFNKRARGEL